MFHLLSLIIRILLCILTMIITDPLGEILRGGCGLDTKGSGFRVQGGPGSERVNHQKVKSLCR